MVKLRHLLNIIKRNTKFPLTNINHEWREGGDLHYHICYAARLLGPDLPKVCSHCTKEGFEPEHEDVCDLCKYSGIMDITEQGFILDIDTRISELHQPATWINIASDKAEPYRGWGEASVPVLSIVRQYAERHGFSFEGCSYPMVKIDDVLLTNGDVYNATIGKYIGDKQEINMNIKFERSE